MSPDGASRSALEPAASLTSVRVKRRRPAPAAGGKRGDLTAGGAPEVILAPPPAGEPEAPPPELLLLPLQAPAPAATYSESPPEPAPPAEEPEPRLPELLLLPPQAPAPAAASSEPAPEPVLAPAPEPEPEPETGELDILDYWDSLRGARNLPALDDLDCAHVAATWPNTLLLAVEQTELPRITRLGENDGEIEYTGMVIDWIMARGRHSARHAEPMEEEQRFAVSSGGARYRLLLLPVGGDGLTSDHVLCQLARVEERGAVASFRRWLVG